MNYTQEWFEAGIMSVCEKFGTLIDAAISLVTPGVGVGPWLTATLVAARVWFETRGVPTVTSRDPVLVEQGLLQLSKETRETYKVKDPFDPAENLRVGVKVWQRWADSFFGWASQKGLRLPTDPIDSGATAWLVTSIGPGAVRWLATQTQSARCYDWRLMSDATLSRGQSAGAFGRQAAAVVRQRINTAWTAATAANGGTMGKAIMLGLIAGATALAVYFYLPVGK